MKYEIIFYFEKLNLFQFLFKIIYNKNLYWKNYHLSFLVF